MVHAANMTVLPQLLKCSIRFGNTKVLSLRITLTEPLDVLHPLEEQKSWSETTGVYPIRSRLRVTGHDGARIDSFEQRRGRRIG